MNASATSSTSPPIRLRDSAEVLAIIPALLGFHPKHSIVVVCLAGPRSLVQLTIRADLPERPTAQSARELIARAAHSNAEAVILVVYTDEPVADGRASLPQRDWTQELCSACAEVNIAVLDAVLAGPSRWWSYLCLDADCCPAGGRPLMAEPPSEVLRFRAESVARGLRVYEKREDLAASVAGPTGETLTAVMAHLDDIGTTLERRLAGGDRDALSAETYELARAVHCRYREGPGALSLPEAARLGLGLHDVQVRDRILGWGGGAQPGALLALLADLARAMPPPQDAPALTTLAWVAYQAGDGALARCAPRTGTGQ